jgi:FtsP/CotA-like multicopper oxidase with cupredoxin domain
VYWYHPHHHGLAADQVFGGLYGDHCGRLRSH